MVAIALASPVAAAGLARRVPAATLLGVVVGWLTLDLLLLCRFLGLANPLVYAGWAALTGALFWLASLPRRRGLNAGPTMATLLVCILVALLLLMLGGEGRFFYANVDWQVRDAVLHDMAINPWPFAYASGDLLRAPIGMYLVPALGGKLWGQAGADLTLLAQNGLLLGLLLAIGSTLFAGRRRQLIALAVFLAFSGLDIVGQLIAGHADRLTPTAHLEGWAPTQFSSTITLIFWVPQHALAGWICALGYLLWRTGRLGLGPLLMLPPLTALWSPLAALGAMPFILHAAWTAVQRRRIAPLDLALPIVATLLAFPALLYLSAAGGNVGLRFYPIPPVVYLIFLLVELLPWLLLGATGWRSRFGGPVLVLVAIPLLALPLIQIGWSTDFAMRGSIPALTILALHIADGLGGRWPMSQFLKAMLVGLLAIGSVTGLTEIARALIFPTSPPPRCGFSRAWDQHFSAWPKDSYLAPLGRIPAAVRPPRPANAKDDRVQRCFDSPWPKPALF